METAEMTQEENQKLRNEVAAELEAEEKGEVVAKPADDSSKKEDKVDDPWAGVNPALKQMFDDMSQKVTAVISTETRLKQAESRIGGLTNELYNAKKAAAEVKDAPTKEQMAAAAESDEKWEALKADFPDWAEAFDGRFSRLLNAKLAELKKEIGSGEATDKLKQEIEQFKTTLAEGTAEEIQKGILGFMKPGWEDTLKSKEYQDWIKKQSEEVFSLTKSPYAKDAIIVLDTFEEAAGKQKSAAEIALERKRRMKAAVIPQGGKSAPAKSEADMTEAELRQSIGKEVYAE